MIIAGGRHIGNERNWNDNGFCRWLIDTKSEGRCAD